MDVRSRLGQRSDVSSLKEWWAVAGSNCGPPACKAGLTPSPPFRPNNLSDRGAKNAGQNRRCLTLIDTNRLAGWLHATKIYKSIAAPLASRAFARCELQVV